MFVPRTNLINAVRRWSLIAAIGVIAVVNVAITSQLTRDSLAETPIDASAGNVYSSLAGETEIADLDSKYFETVEMVDVPAPHNPIYKNDALTVTRPAAIKRQKVERMPRDTTAHVSKRRPAKLFEPIVITYAGPAKSLTAKSETDLARSADGPVALSERFKPHQKDPFALRMIKKPYDWLKTVASKLR